MALKKGADRGCQRVVFHGIGGSRSFAAGTSQPNLFANSGDSGDRQHPHFSILPQGCMRQHLDDRAAEKIDSLRTVRILVSLHSADLSCLSSPAWHSLRECNFLRVSRKMIHVIRNGSVKAALLAGAALVAGSAAAQDIADTVYTGGPILTIDDAQPTVEAVAVKDGKILAVGSMADLLKHQDDTTDVFDLDGRAMLPGFVDSHGHVVMGGFRRFRRTFWRRRMARSPTSQACRQPSRHGWRTMPKWSIR